MITADRTTQLHADQHREGRTEFRPGECTCVRGCHINLAEGLGNKCYMMRKLFGEETQRR